MNNDRINVYTCKAGHQTVTIDRDEGVTPMMLKCYHGGCGQSATSSFYKVPAGLTPTHEWYTPTGAELEVEIMKFELKNPGNGTRQYKQWLESSTNWFRDHVAKGGLLIREIEV